MLPDRYSYFAELRRQELASTSVYNVMLHTCQLSAEINDLLSQMEADEIEADLHTYVALHQAWCVDPSSILCPLYVCMFELLFQNSIGSFV